MKQKPTHQHHVAGTMLTVAAAMCLTIVLSALASSCGTATRLHREAYADYLHALAESQKPSPDKVSHTLMPISDDNHQLEWRTVDDTKMVLVCKFIDTKSIPIWTHPDTFRIKAKNGYWVSLPADWKRRADQFVGLDSAAACDRMVQMLGLWPECDYSMVVLFYADVSRMFRPAYDPTMSTAGSPAEFPQWADESYTVGETNFRDWFARQQKTAYSGKGACPWGQLGYSYDWHRGAPTQGLSEYIVTNNTLVRVKTCQSAWKFIQSLTAQH